MFNWKAEIEGDRMRFLGEEYPLGHFCLELLQRALVDDAAQRVSILWAFLEPTLHELQNGLILENHLLQIRDIILPVLPYLETLPPFDRVGVSELRQSAETLLSEETAAQMMDYVKQSGALSVDQAELWAQYNYGLPKNPAKHPGKQLLEDAKTFLSEFITLANDLGDVSRWLREFVRRLNELESTKPEDLLGLASQIFLTPELSLQNHYLDEDSDTSVQHMVFTNLRAFLLTDFYEGLAHNHYPRRCPVCKRYFLMEHAYRQKYCKGYAPLELTGGKQILCADFALPADSGFEKEAAAASDVLRKYESSTGTLRSYASRGKITEEAKEAAIRLAGERRDEAIRDHDYATGRYLEEIHFKRLLSDLEEEQ